MEEGADVLVDGGAVATTHLTNDELLAAFRASMTRETDDDATLALFSDEACGIYNANSLDSESLKHITRCRVAYKVRLAPLL